MAVKRADVTSGGVGLVAEAHIAAELAAHRRLPVARHAGLDGKLAQSLLVGFFEDGHSGKDTTRRGVVSTLNLRLLKAHP